MNNPSVTEHIVEEAIALRINRVWMHNNTLMPSSVSPKAVELCRAKGIIVIDVGCPMMFLSPDFFHKGMRWVINATGRMK
jgi:predicted CoA-binding protein